MDIISGMSEALEQSAAERAALERNTAYVKAVESDPMKAVRVFKSGGYAARGNSKDLPITEARIISDLSSMLKNYKVNAERTYLDNYPTEFSQQQHLQFKQGEQIYIEALKELGVK